MFKVPDGGKIEMGIAFHATERVWLSLPLTDDSLHNVIEVSVRLEDLEAAISRYKSAVKAHA